MRNSYKCALAVAVLAGCRDSTDPGNEPWNARIHGHVFLASGGPLQSGNLVISCSSGAATFTTPLDATGQYLAEFEIDGHLAVASSGKIECQLGAPDSINAKVHTTALVLFYPPTVRHGVQQVELHE